MNTGLISKTFIPLGNSKIKKKTGSLRFFAHLHFRSWEAKLAFFANKNAYEIEFNSISQTYISEFIGACTCIKALLYFLEHLKTFLKKRKNQHDLRKSLY